MLLFFYGFNTLLYNYSIINQHGFICYNNLLDLNIALYIIYVLLNLINQSYLTPTPLFFINTPNPIYKH